jgi:tetratricopeptide (TPR) repeat protein
MKKVFLALAALLLVASPALADKSEADRLMSAGHKANGAGKAKRAIELFTKAIETGQLKGLKLASAYSARAGLKSNMGDYKAAVADLTRAIDLFPNEVYYYPDRGRIYISMNRPLEAAADFTKLITLMKKPSGWAYFYRCQAWAKAGKSARAIADCRMTLKLKPEDRRAKRLLESLEKGG